MRLAVVDHERVADKLGNDRARPSPRRDRFLHAPIVQPLHFLVKLRVDVRTFFEGSTHGKLSVVQSWSLVSVYRRLTTSDYTYFVFNFCTPYRRLRRRRIIALFDALRGWRVMPPLALLPVGLTGCRPPLVRPSPPPCGWSIGFIAVPRTCDLRPSHRRATRLAVHDAHVVRIAGRADRRPAGRRNAANFAAGQRNLRPARFAGHQRRARAGAAAQRAAAAGLQLDVVNRHAQRNLRQRQAIAHRRRRVRRRSSPCRPPSGRSGATMYRFSPSA